MKNNIKIYRKNRGTERTKNAVSQRNKVKSQIKSGETEMVGTAETDHILPEVLVISSYPPRECGIATYSQDLIKALNNQFGLSFAIKVCALETSDQSYSYTDEVKYILNTSDAPQF